MALYHQLKFPSTFIEYRSGSEWKGVVVISNFDSLEAALGSSLVCLGLNTPLGHILRWNCRLQHVTEGKKGGWKTMKKT